MNFFKKRWYIIPAFIVVGLIAMAYVNYTHKPAEYLQAEQLIENQLFVALGVESLEFVRTFTGRDSALVILDYMETLPPEKQLVDLLSKEWDLIDYYDQRKTVKLGEVWKAKLENGKIVFMLSVDGEFVGLLDNRYSVSY